MRKLQAITMMKLGIPLSDIKTMSEDEFNAYFVILSAMEESSGEKK